MSADEDRIDREIAANLEKLISSSENLQITALEERLKTLELFTKDTIFCLLLNGQKLYAHLMMNSTYDYNPELAGNFSNYLSELNRIIESYFKEFQSKSDESDESGENDD